MKVAVLGSGMMGSVISWDLSRSPSVDEVAVCDLSEDRLKALRRRVGGRKLTTERVDVKDRRRVVQFMRGRDVVASALPHGSVAPADVAAAEAGAKLVDIAFEDAQMTLDATVRANSGLLIPGCGLAPGLGGILLAHGVRTVGADEGHILVGGIPRKPLPPFGYRLVFSIVGLLREYTDEARVFRAGRMVKVKPFDTVERVKLPKVGPLEAFCTDGLASLVYTMKGMRVMDEKTLRWPGHAEKMRLLLDSGFFSTKELEVGGGSASPLEMSWKVLERTLSGGTVDDMTVMRVVASSRRREVTFDLLDRFDSRTGITSMGRTTGFTCSIVAQMVGSGEISGRGVIPPERAVTGKRVEKLVEALASRGVKIAERRRTKR